jgi:hypothetical protein
MRASTDVLVVMAKYPAPGTVKTRLAARVGAARACALYGAFLGDIAARFDQCPWSLVWAVTPAGADLTPLVGAGGRQIAQHGDDLGERMRHCFARLFADGATRVVMIGADAPHIADVSVSAAFAALDDCDAAFVPTRDGGYCLIGLRAPHDLFSGVSMGEPTVFEQTRARLAALGLCSLVLPETFDVDELADVAELARVIESGVVALPRTAAVLREWRAAGITWRAPRRRRQGGGDG